MAPYRQACSGCVGQSVTAIHDVDRYKSVVEYERSMERLAIERSRTPDLRHGGGMDGPPEMYEAEAEHHGALARSAEGKLARARKRLAVALDPRPCFLCNGSGYLVAPGSFIQGAAGSRMGDS